MINCITTSEVPTLLHEIWNHRNTCIRYAPLNKAEVTFAINALKRNKATDVDSFLTCHFHSFKNPLKWEIRQDQPDRRRKGWLGNHP